MKRLSLSMLGVLLACGAPGPGIELPDTGAVTTDAGEPAAFALASPVLSDGGTFPMRYTCKDATTMGKVSLPLSWTGSPDAGSYALVMTDTTINLVHWVIWDLSAATQALPEGVENVAAPPTPAGAKQTTSYDNATFGYRGPCPPTSHVYTLSLSALDVATLPGVTTASTRAQVQSAIAAHALASTALSGSYGP